MALTKKQDLCPKCFLQDGLDVPLIYHLGSTQPMKCKNEHVFDDRAELSELTKQMNDQRRALAPKVDLPPPKIDDDPLPPPDESNKLGESTSPIPTTGVKPLTISSVDMVRLTSILGTFKDSSTLFGSIFALQQELNDTRELLRRMQDAKAVGRSSPGDKPRAIGGDAIIDLIIPERWVQSINDIAEANGMSLTRYMNAKIEDGLDNNWYS